MVASGLQSTVIQWKGRWSSGTFMPYVRTKLEDSRGGASGVGNRRYSRGHTTGTGDPLGERQRSVPIVGWCKPLKREEQNAAKSLLNTRNDEGLTKVGICIFGLCFGLTTEPRALDLYSTT